MHNFKELKIGQKSRKLVKEDYLIAKSFPKEERFELVSQIRRSVISIPSNIAEGSGRGSEKEFERFLNIAISSAFELETQIILAFDLNYVEEIEFNRIEKKISEIQRMIFGFRKTLKSN